MPTITAVQAASVLLGNRATLRGAAPARRLRLARLSKAPLHLVTARSGGRRPDRAAAATPPPVPPPAFVAEPADGSRGWRTFWTAIDTSAWLGTVGTAVAFILTQEAMLAGAPVVLPLLALYASRQREKLAAASAQQAQLSRLEALLLDLQAETADEVAAEVGAEVQGLLQQLQQQQRAAGGPPSPEVGKLLRGLDAKLSAMEGSVTGTGAATQDALQRSTEQQGQLANSVMARLQDLGTALRRDVNGALQAAGEVEMGALARLDARMASLEGSIVGLQAAQSDGLMRLNGGLQAAVADATGALQEAVREETYRSLDPLRRLPELMQGALPVTPEVLVAPLDGGSPAVSEDSLRQLIGEALGGATQQILEQQAALLEELAAQPQAIAPQQWSQLGGRLASLQEQMQDLAQLQVAASEAAAAAAAGGGGQAEGGIAATAAAAAGAEVAAVAAELSALRSDVSSLTGAVRQLLDMQQQQQQAAGGASSGDGTNTAAARSLPLPGTTMAGVAAAVQAVQDQVVLLRQDLQEGDASYASVVGLEQQLEVALAALFQDLAVVDSPASGSSSASGGGNSLSSSDNGISTSAAASASAASTVAAEQQQAALSAALGSLAALGGRLDGMSAQLAALQAGMAAVAAAPPPAATVPQTTSVQQDDASGQQQQQAQAQQQQEQEEEQEAQPATVPVASAAVPEGRQAAFSRMQELLQQKDERLGGGDGGGDNGGTAFAEWLSGHRDNGVPSSAAVGAGLTGATAGRSSGTSSSPGSDSGLQQQIEFAAAIGMPQEGAELAAGAGPGAASTLPSSTAVLPSAGPSSPYDAAPNAGSQQAVPWQASEAAASESYGQQYERNQQYEQQQYEQQYQLQEYEQGEQQPQYEQQQYQQQQYEQQQAQPPPPGLQQQQQQQPAVGQGAAPPSAEQLYERGVQRLREGRALAATTGADWALAESALREAAASFEQVLSLHDPSNIRARGNYGNALLSQGRLKKQMIDWMGGGSPAPGDAAQAADLAATLQRLETEAEELLLLAGRQYKAVLEADPQQAKAFINWGRVIGLRADMARTAGDITEGGRLFGLAADKFDAALDLEPQNLPALRLGGQAVLDAALCMLSSDPAEARALLKDAAAYLEAALALDSQDGESAAALQRCRQQLAAMREQRQAQA